MKGFYFLFQVLKIVLHILSFDCYMPNNMPVTIFAAIGICNAVQ